jgi:aminotransferase
VKLRRSPTLELAASIQRARDAGEIEWSLSTPSFQPCVPAISLGRDWSLLTPAAGLPDLRARARDWLFQRWTLPDHQCLITAGAKAAIFSVLRALVPPGAPVLVVAPFWPSYEDLAAAATLNLRSIETTLANGFRIDPEEVASLAAATGARALVLSNPNNPTGRIYSREELEGLVRVARRHAMLLLLDESFSDIIHDQQSWRDSRCESDESLVLVNSFSKNLHLQGLRVGACMVHRKYAEAVLTVHQTIMSAAPSLGQHVIAQLLAHGEVEQPDYTRQRRMALDFIHARGWRVVEPAGTFYAFPEVTDLGVFRAQAARRQVFLLSGEAFGIPYGRHLRLCYGKPESELADILARLDQAGVS